MRRWAQALQGGYYLVTGVWPLLHFRSFTAASGPKPDRFQTQVAGALFAAVGLALLGGERGTRGSRLLSGGVAAAALAMESAYRRYLPRVFALDAALQSMFLAAAVTPLQSDRRHPTDLALRRAPDRGHPSG
ncbi:MAG TPA: hypothetical protein VFX61_18080 [Micromonosporaceae bacterium]|nr:hypothetical protein [Micromonosporaceae bacterium]